jgi:hypothetical protein
MSCPYTYNLISEREKYKKMADEMEKTFAELSVY